MDNLYIWLLATPEVFGGCEEHMRKAWVREAFRQFLDPTWVYSVEVNDRLCKSIKATYYSGFVVEVNAVTLTVEIRKEGQAITLHL